MHWQNCPLAPLTASLLLRRKSGNSSLNKAERFALHCQKLEDGWHGKLVVSIHEAAAVWLAEKGLTIPGLKYDRRGTRKNSTFKTFLQGY